MATRADALNLNQAKKRGKSQHTGRNWEERNVSRDSTGRRFRTPGDSSQGPPREQQPGGWGHGKHIRNNPINI